MNQIQICIAINDKNSPMKLHDNGTPIFANVKKKNIVEYKGIVNVIPL